MNTFNKKSLYVALASMGALGVTGAAQAVNVNPDGLGQALIYPYYTVQSKAAGLAPFNSLLSVVNSTASAKAVKVRFLEGKASKEVLDFNLYLSANDVWTAAIIPTELGAGVFTTDLSCTSPKVSSSASAPTPFVNFAYTGSNDDPLENTLDRTREGYVEIIEMGDVVGTLATSVTHTSSGGAPACTGLPTAATTPIDLRAGSGGLFGGMTLINVLAGEDYTQNAMALTSFSATTLWGSPGSIQPDLSQVNPKTSVVFNNTEVVTTDWSGTSNTVDAVSAVLMHNQIYNEFVLDTVTKSGTDWVVTFPTKHFYYTGNTVTKLFQRNLGASGACDDVSITQYNREEVTVASSITFSPPPPTQTDSLCYEANVITFNHSSVLGSKNESSIPTLFQNGWAKFGFSGVLVGGASLRTSTATGAQTTLAVTTYSGLPVIGFAAESFQNGTIAGPTVNSLVQSQYGGSFDHRGTRSIQ